MTTRIEMNKVDFTSNLKKFVSATNNSIKYARQLAIASIVHFEKHGDVVYIQEFLDAMPKNYVRKTAYLAWCKAFTPLGMDDDGKLFKDKSDDAIEFDIDGALTKDFWDFSPEGSTILFNETDVLKSMQKALAKFKNKKHKAKSESAVNVLTKAEAAVKAFEEQLKAEAEAAADEPDEDTDGQEEMAPESSESLESTPAISDAPDQTESAEQAAEAFTEAAEAA